MPPGLSFKPIGKGISRKKKKGGLLPRCGIRHGRKAIFGFICFFVRHRRFRFGGLLRCGRLRRLGTKGCLLYTSFWRTTGGFELILVTEDRQIYVTPGLADAFTLRENAGDFVVEAVEA